MSDRDIPSKQKLIDMLAERSRKHDAFRLAETAFSDGRADGYADEMNAFDIAHGEVLDWLNDTDHLDELLGFLRAAETSDVGCHGLDNARQVFFYEQDFYVLSNFSAFCVHWRGKPFFTSEHAYHWARFELPNGRGVLLQDCVQRAASAHEAFKFAQAEKSKQRADWDAVKVDTMREILRAKADQHEYVARKLDATGDRELIENSWRDDFWGWGPNRDGQNMLGRLWMEVRAERRARHPKTSCSAPSINKPAQLIADAPDDHYCAHGYSIQSECHFCGRFR